MSIDVFWRISKESRKAIADENERSIYDFYPLSFFPVFLTPRDNRGHSPGVEVGLAGNPPVALQPSENA